jgi:ribosomal protein S18 acetylase RimI-like enzyme
MAAVTLAFRFAEERDVPAIVDLIESAYRGEASRAGWTTEADLLGGQRTDTDAVLGVLRTPGSVMLLAEAGGQLAGCCQLARRPRDEAYFGMFSVLPGRQGQGWGREILAEAERLARDDWGARTMVMTVLAQRGELIAWYERRGYRRTGDSKPFPYGDARFGIPKRPDLSFAVLSKPLVDVSSPAVPPQPDPGLAPRPDPGPPSQPDPDLAPRPDPDLPSQPDPGLAPRPDPDLPSHRLT